MQVQNVKVIGDGECITQHKLLVCQINLRTKIRKNTKLHQNNVSGNYKSLRFKRNTKKLSRTAL